MGRTLVRTPAASTPVGDPGAPDPERSDGAAPSDSLRVAVMGRSLRGEFSGVVRYTYELIEALAPRFFDPLTVFLTRAEDGLNGARIRRIRAPFPTPNEYARALWEQTVVPVAVARLRPDVYHSPNYILPAALRCPAVVTVHDLAFLDRSLHRLRSHVYLSVLTTMAIGKAARIVCVSEYTRQRLVDRFPSAASRTRVIGEGVSPRFTPQPGIAVERFRRRFGLVDPYVLFVGTIEPRKNLPRLIEAFGAAVAGHAFPHRLIIAGGKGWMNGPVRRAYDASPVRDRIHFAGYVDDAELAAAYTGADVFVYPSLQEGYGLPALEAMACGTAVLTSNATSLPEVVGDAALVVDPTDTGAIASALSALLRDRMLREDLAGAGIARARQFRWDDVAARTAAVYAEAAG